MKALIVGAGSVGQIYGYALQQGGAEVSVYVRPKYIEESRKGFALYPLNRGRSPAPVRFTPNSVLSNPAEVAAAHWDVVMLCVPTTGVSDPGFGALLDATGDATIVSLIPGPDAAAFVAQHIPASRTASGLIPLISYPTPMPGESRPEPGTAYWVPPFSHTPLTGPLDRTEIVARTLRAGKLPAKAKPETGAISGIGFPDALLLILVQSLKHSGWKFRGLYQNFATFRDARREAALIVERKTGTKRPAWLEWIGVPALKLVAFASRVIVPFDMEIYLQVHFTKVGEQMRLGLEKYIGEAEALGIEVRALPRIRA